MQNLVLQEKNFLSQQPGALINGGYSRFPFNSNPASGLSCFVRAK